MERIFQDENIQQQFEAEGFVVIPFLDPEELEAIRQHYQILHPENPGKGFYSTTFSEDDTYKKALYEGVKSVFQPRVDEKFTGVKNLGASFLVKYPGQPGHMPSHQDWTVVDEEKFRSITIWVPLQDVNEENGAITVLPGSHEYTRVLRAPTLPPVIREIDPLIRARMKTLSMQAGSAFIFDHSVIHASHLNQSDTPRIAVTYGLVPEKAQMMYYFRENGSEEVEKYHVPDDFFLRYPNIGSRPETGELVEKKQLKFPQLTPEQFFAAYARHSAPVSAQAKQKKRMKPVFKDPELQAQFDQNGYVKIPLLGEEDVKKLRDFYASLEKEIPDYGFHVSMDVKNRDQVIRVSEELKAVLGAQCDRFFQDYRIFTGSYVVKEPNPKGVVPPHQDWTFVDETEYWSATLWTPLQDVDMHNGALGVIHGSSTFFDFSRPSPSPQTPTPLGPHMFSIFPYLDVIEMKAGEALVFNNQTIHASPPNTTENTRLACGIGITHKDAKLYHHYNVPGTDPAQVEVYEIEPDFFLEFNNGMLSEMYNQGKKPEGQKVVRTYELGERNVSNEELMAMIKAHPDAQINGPLIEKMAKLFGYNMDGSKKEEPQPEPVTAGNGQPERVGLLGRLKRFLGGKN